MTDSRRRFCEQTMGLRHVIPQGMGLRREVSALDKKEAMFLSLGPKSHTVIGMRISIKVRNYTFGKKMSNPLLIFLITILP